VCLNDPSRLIKLRGMIPTFVFLRRLVDINQSIYLLCRLFKLVAFVGRGSSRFRRLVDQQFASLFQFRCIHLSFFACSIFHSILNWSHQFSSTGFVLAARWSSSHFSCSAVRFHVAQSHIFPGHWFDANVCPICDTTHYSGHARICLVWPIVVCS
jgi:hypothetical protein